MSVIADKIAEPQILPHEAEARQSAEAEPPYPPVDSLEDRQYHQVRYYTTLLLWRSAGEMSLLEGSMRWI